MKKTSKFDSKKAALLPTFTVCDTIYAEESHTQLKHDRNEREYRDALNSFPPEGCGWNAHSILAVRYGTRLGLSVNQIEADITSATGLILSPARLHDLNRDYAKAIATEGTGDVRTITAEVKYAKKIANNFNVRDNTLELVDKKYENVNSQNVKDLSPVDIPADAVKQCELFLNSIYSADDFIFIGNEFDSDVKKFGKFSTKNAVKLPHFIPCGFSGKEAKVKNRDKMSKRCDGAVVNAMVTMFEFDGLPIESQLKFCYHLIKIGIPVAGVVSSGNKSIHCYVAVNLKDDLNEWNAKVKEILYKGILEKVGVDPACKNVSRLSRLPGHLRKSTGKLQELLYINPSVIVGKGVDDSKVISMQDTIDILVNDSLICNVSDKAVITTVEGIKNEEKKVKPHKFHFETISTRAKKKKVNEDGTIDEEEEPTDINIDINEYVKFLQMNGFGKIYSNGSKDGSFIQEHLNIINETSSHRLIDFTLGYVSKMDKELPDCKNYHSSAEIESILRSKNKFYFGADFLATLKPVSKTFHKDNINFSYTYYSNCFVSTGREGSTIHEYEELPSVIWESQKLNRSYFCPDDNEAMFSKFIRNVCSNDIDRINCLRTAIGYMLHRFKRDDRAFAVGLIDESMDSSEKGGNGKSLITKAIEKMRCTVNMNGETDDFSGKNIHLWQEVCDYTDIVSIDDLPQGFEFRKLFTMLTGEWSVKKMRENRYTMQFKDSPKIMYTSNHQIAGIHSSDRRRKKEVELSAHYTSEFSPADEFKCMFFTGWDSKEWNRFDGFMLECISSYLKAGKVTDYKRINVDERQIEVEVKSVELREYFEDLLEATESVTENGKIAKSWRFREYNKFRQANPDYRKIDSEQTFGKEFVKYLEAKGRRRVKVEGCSTDCGTKGKPRHVTWTCDKVEVKKEE